MAAGTAGAWDEDGVGSPVVRYHALTIIECGVPSVALWTSNAKRILICPFITDN
jgi:hypothetical protein